MTIHSKMSPASVRLPRKLLIANRGEIASRIIRTAKRLGIATVAVFSDADRDAPYVAQADEAYWIGPSEAKQSYLKQDVILDVAKRSGAEAVHPGYGFLSENADFSERCQAEGIIFVGPPASAIHAMGEKARAKALMEKANVPLVPGYHGEDQSPHVLKEYADKIGYPLLIKASAGGGGKGMKVVSAHEEFDEALASAKREALSSFGDDHVLLERYLIKPRHVEVQVFADSYGNCVHLYDRDCSVQRRHQKVVEEAPAPGIPDEVREKLHQAAVTAAKAINYVGAGTIEFLYSEADQQFYFMEMNTRLQVEHPVTEMITGLDLVAWQLEVAAGAPLPLMQKDIHQKGHALEVRLYAENPEQEFLPQSGQLTALALPNTSDSIRVDTGVNERSLISVFYDPMIAKIIAYGTDREAAIFAMQKALAETYVGGITSNIAFLERIIRSDEFITGAPDTGFIERNRETLLGQAEQNNRKLALAVSGILFDRVNQAAAAQAVKGYVDPWDHARNWRLNLPVEEVIRLRDGEREISVLATWQGGHLLLQLPDGARLNVTGTLEGNRLSGQIDDLVCHALWFRSGQNLSVLEQNGRGRFVLETRKDYGTGDDGAADGAIKSPMPGRVISVLVEPGQEVVAGEILVIVEAMKMEHALKASQDAKVAQVRCHSGDQVEESAELIVLETV
ncbi:acetyl/propionyl/methylcrotonyl-CoA carboxylase subunit alpha [Microvirga sp. W0021]|uniref:Acetyl/propionyl/methylcrotonyl-CoA carboxylase subunit alpha n=1 Tax=Hohaiivirga grylli TaxID=3133970 RepID=A0ABV0BGS9_9HYPH